MQSNISSRQSLGIYVHIPFCKSRCIYCDFVSSVDSVAQRKKYVDYLCRQVELAGVEYARDYAVDTLYFGGGTPTLLDGCQLKRISEHIFNTFDYNLKEFSVEANPCTIDRDKLTTLKDIGVTRLSIGVQSFNDGLLKMLGRRHDSICAQRTVRLAKEFGFEVSVDSMIGLPNQTQADIEDFVAEAQDLGVDHVSVYMLSIEDGTRLKSLVETGELKAKGDDEIADMYELACRCLQAAGYDRYEISNFCKDGKVSYHNLRYWQSLDYLGLGMGAHSLAKGERWHDADKFDLYYDSIENRKFKFDRQKLSRDEIESEYIMLSLRLQSGVDLQEFFQRFGSDFATKYRAAIVKNKDYLDISPSHIAIKYRYLQMMNSIIVDFI